MTDFGIQPQTLAIYQAAQEMYRRHNHTFIGSADLIRCDCNHWTIVAPPMRGNCIVVVCANCGDWHTVLFK